MIPTLVQDRVNWTKCRIKGGTKISIIAVAWLVVFFGPPGAGETACAQHVPPAPHQTPAVRQAAAPASGAFVPSVYKTFAEWKAACDRLPSNRSLKFNLPPADRLPLKSFREFAEVLQAYLNLCKTNSLAEPSAWFGDGPVKPQFFNTDEVYFLKPPIPFQPFVERRLLPAGTQVIFFGDLHGDVRSMVARIDWLNRNGYMQDFRLTRPDVCLVFLGDYTDRGSFGIEVLYTLMRLKLDNPDRVIMVRGNHEDVSLAARYGFIAEGRGKYGRDFDAKRVLRMYDFLPVVLYLGTETDLLQCNHGGMEPGFDPRPLLDAPSPARYQLLGRLEQQRFLKEHPRLAASLPAQTRRLLESTLLDFQPETPTAPLVIGFMWNDFTVVRGETGFDFDPGRAFVYGEGPTRFILEQYSTGTRRLRAVFRAHQHASILNSMMRRLKASKGVYEHWQENDSVGLLNADPAVIAPKLDVSAERRIRPQSVWTFNVSPDSVYGEACDYTFDAFGILTLAERFENWRLRVVNQTIRN